MKQNHGSDWSGDDWDDGSGSGLSDCKYFSLRDFTLDSRV